LKIKAARWVDILEEAVAKVEMEFSGDDAQIKLHFRAFELKTLMMDLA